MFYDKTIAALATQLCLFLYIFANPPLGGTADVPALERLDLGYSTAGSVATASLWVTQDIGAFKKHGFDIRPIYLAGGLAPVALMAGEIQVAIMSAGVLIPPALKSPDLVMIAALSNYISHALLVAPEITEPKLLKGKRIAIQRLGDLTHIAAREAVKYAGLSETEAVYQQIGGTPTRFAALQSGHVQAAVLSPPYLGRARKIGFRVMVNLYDQKIPFIALGLVTTKRYIATRRPVVLNLLKAFSEGIHYYKREPEASRRILQRHLPGVPADELAEGIEHYSRDLEGRPYPRPEGLKIALDLVSQQTPAAKGVDPERFTDPSLLRDLERAGFFTAFTSGK
jgi:ABC-type nitrate/sulfonate/bicarbonate transport system substrate-binding protein